MNDLKNGFFRQKQLRGSNQLFCNCSTTCLHAPNRFCKQCQQRVCASHCVPTQPRGDEFVCLNCQASFTRKQCCLCMNAIVAVFIFAAIIVCLFFLIQEWMHDSTTDSPTVSA